jgi:hypothetical protein
MPKKLEELARAFKIFESIPFPEDSDDDEFSQLHAELVEYDGYIAGLISTLLEGGYVSPNLLRFDYDLQARLQKIVIEGTPESSLYAKKYLNYLDALKQLLELVKARLL